MRSRKLSDTITEYYVSAEEQPKLKEEDISKYKRSTEWQKLKSWKSFDTYISGISRLWLVKFDSRNWNKSSCTCPIFLKTYICKHIIGLAVKLNIFELTPQAKSLPLGVKRKRGRPALAKKALVTQ